MIHRRHVLLAIPAALLLATVPASAAPDPAAFIDQTGHDLIAIVNGTASLADKQVALQAVVDRAVDVDAIAKFCLGRFWRTASAAQRAAYQQLFHRVLMKSITGHLGEFQGVTVTVGKTVPRDDAVGVTSVIARPNSAPANVEWLVSTATGSPRIIDVVAEGTSLRLTQRSDYAAFIGQHGGDVNALIDALKQQADKS